MPSTDTNTNYYHESFGEGPAIVFIHGLGVDHRLWYPLREHLDSDHTTIAYDYRGHGKTGETDRESYSISLLADDLRQLLEEQEVDEAILCCHSYGGLIATEYASTYPDSVNGLVYLDARIEMGTNTFESTMLRLWPALSVVLKTVGLQRFNRLTESIAERVYDMDDPEAQIETLGMSLEEYTMDARKQLTANEMDKLFRAARSYSPDLEGLSGIPVTVLYGEGTAGPVRENAETLASHLSDVDIRECENAGHGLPVQVPEKISAVIRERHTET